MVLLYTYMKRFSISIGWPQYEALIKRSKQIGVSLGELIRRAIDEFLGKK